MALEERELRGLGFLRITGGDEDVKGLQKEVENR